MKEEFRDVYQDLKHVLAGFAGELVCVRDDAGDYYLDTAHIMKNRNPLFFGAVKINKSYVSYHLMPVYVFPDLLEEISPALRRRMQGKSCFNFKTVDPRLFSELAMLTEAGFQRYREAGYV